MTSAKFKKETQKNTKNVQFKLDAMEHSKKANTVDTDNESKKYAKTRN